MAEQTMAVAGTPCHRRRGNRVQGARTQEDTIVPWQWSVIVLGWIMICALDGHAERIVQVQADDPQKNTHAEYLLNGRKTIVTLESARNLRDALRAQLKQQADDPWIKTFVTEKLVPGNAAIDPNGTLSMGPWRLFAEHNELRLAMQYWISPESFCWIRTIVSRSSDGNWLTGPLQNRDPHEPVQLEYRLGRKKIIVTREDAREMYEALSAQLKRQADDPELKEFAASLTPGEPEMGSTVLMGRWQLFAEEKELRLSQRIHMSRLFLLVAKTSVTRTVGGGWQTGPITIQRWHLAPSQTPP